MDDALDLLQACVPNEALDSLHVRSISVTYQKRIPLIKLEMHSLRRLLLFLSI